ncbi:MAG: LysE family transporter [Pseudomonadota bacterium]|nr:LysE family transporter [Pseudomonadota bacterium]
MISFILAVILLIITPGPGVLSVAGVGAAFGASAGRRYIVGLFLGNNLVSFIVVTGLAALILAYPFARFFLMLLSASFLLYLCYKIAFEGVDLAFKKKTVAPGVVAGIVLQVLNPKAYAVNAAVYTGFVIYSGNFFFEAAVKFLVYNTIWVILHIFWLILGLSIRKLQFNETTKKVVNIVMATSLFMVVSLMILSELF